MMLSDKKFALLFCLYPLHPIWLPLGGGRGGFNPLFSKRDIVPVVLEVSLW